MGLNIIGLKGSPIFLHYINTEGKNERLKTQTCHKRLTSQVKIILKAGFLKEISNLVSPGCINCRKIRLHFHSLLGFKYILML